MKKNMRLKYSLYIPILIFVFAAWFVFIGYDEFKSGRKPACEHQVGDNEDVLFAFSGSTISIPQAFFVECVSRRYEASPGDQPKITLVVEVPSSEFLNRTDLSIAEEVVRIYLHKYWIRPTYLQHSSPFQEIKKKYEGLTLNGQSAYGSPIRLTDEVVKFPALLKRRPYTRDVYVRSSPKESAVFLTCDSEGANVASSKFHCSSVPKKISDATAFVYLHNMTDAANIALVDEEISKWVGQKFLTRIKNDSQSLRME